ncbi:hypothetical protein B0H14DRAFT_2561933 [Mycena olivaceomarginata]|nr:hypothetical protein B0H14DRAFT_2561933 [Mycena olivaceomarginata]
MGPSDRPVLPSSRQTVVTTNSWVSTDDTSSGGITCPKCSKKFEKGATQKTLRDHLASATACKVLAPEYRLRGWSSAGRKLCSRGRRSRKHKFEIVKRAQVLGNNVAVSSHAMDAQVAHTGPNMISTEAANMMKILLGFARCPTPDQRAEGVAEGRPIFANLKRSIQPAKPSGKASTPNDSDSVIEAVNTPLTTKGQAQGTSSNPFDTMGAWGSGSGAHPRYDYEQQRKRRAAEAVEG